MRTLTQHVPELAALESREHLIRIPPETDVAITPRVRQLIDCVEFQRLTGISQLGLVGHVYPAAHHTRFEHCLGVYLVALQYLQRLQHDPRFAETIDPHDAEVFLVASLLHDLGHWPFCHPIEDMHLSNVPEHELFANSFLLEGEVADTLRDEWKIAPREVVSLLSERPRDRKSRILASMLSGPIDVDKMDYLRRDSLHAGVPYGRNFDAARLIGSLCLNEAGDGIALTDKGKTAAEMMVFARYVMFSEVYWHHAVRSATAMLQRAFYLTYEQLDLDGLFRVSEDAMIQSLRKEAKGGPAEDLLEGLFGAKRSLYKRLFQYSHFQDREMYEQLARKPFAWLVVCSENFARLASQQLGRRIAPHEVLIDAPPPALEIEFKVDIYFTKENQYRTLGEVSPVVQTLAQKQFDDYVKRVRVFVHPALIDDFRAESTAREMLKQAIEQSDDAFETGG